MGYMLATARRRRSGGSGAPPAPDYAAEVEAFLSGGPGYAIDNTSVSRMWLESTKVTPVASASDPVGAFETVFGSATRNFAQTTDANRPTWDGVGSIISNGTTQFIETIAADRGLLNGKTAAFGAGRYRPTNLADARGLWMFSASAAGNARFAAWVNTDGSVSVAIRRLDGDSPQTFTSATGLVVADTAFDFMCSLDLTGSTILGWLDGAEIINAAPTGSGGFSATNSSRVGWAFTFGTSRYMLGKAGRGVFADKLPSAGERTSIRGWMGGVAL